MKLIRVVLALLVIAPLGAQAPYPVSQDDGVTICASTNGICPPANTVTQNGVTVEVLTYNATATYTSSWQFGNNQLSAFATGTVTSPTTLSSASTSTWSVDPGNPLSGYVIGWANNEDILTISAPGLSGQTGQLVFDIAMNLQANIVGVPPFPGNSSFFFNQAVYGTGVSGGWQQQFCNSPTSSDCGKFTFTTPVFNFVFGSPFNLSFYGSARTGTGYPGTFTGTYTATADESLVQILNAAGQPVLGAQITSAEGAKYVIKSTVVPAREYVISGTRIEAFDSAGNFLLQFGATGSGNGQFQLPSGIAVDSSGDVWVTDAILNRVQKFDANGNYLSQFGSTGLAPGFLYQPYGLALDSYGNAWIADTGNNRIQEFSASGTFLQQVGGLGGGNGQFFGPVGIAIDSANNIWVADTGSDRIQKFSASGSAGVPSTVVFQLKFGSYGNGNGQFRSPYSISADPSGNVWVADSLNQRIQEFSSGGSFVKSLFGPFTYPSPYGVSVDNAGNIWAVDFGANRVLQFNNSSGAETLTFGTTGGAAGQLFQPTYIAVH